MEVQNTTRKIEDSLRLMLNVVHKQSIRLKRTSMELSIVKQELADLKNNGQLKVVKQDVKQADALSAEPVEEVKKKRTYQKKYWREQDNSDADSIDSEDDSD